MNLRDKYWDQTIKISLNFGTLIDRKVKRLVSFTDSSSISKIINVKQSELKDFLNYMFNTYKEELIEQNSPSYKEGNYVLVLKVTIREEYYFKSDGILANKLLNDDLNDIEEFLNHKELIID